MIDFTLEYIPVLLLVITLLLTIIGFFLKQLHSVIQTLSDTMNDLKLSLETAKQESKRGYENLKIMSIEHGKQLSDHSRRIENNQELINELRRAK